MAEPRRFRKKPVVIEAIRFDGQSSASGIIDWVLAGGGSARYHDDPVIIIDTMEGTMRANDGDWVIRGVKSEFYPCKADIFEATYEPVDDSDS